MRFIYRASQLDPVRDILDQGFRFVFLDIDNTLLPRDTGVMPDDIKDWLNQLKQSGVVVALISNNWHESVYQFAEREGLPIVAKAVKPLPFAFWRAMNKVGANPQESLMIGDQLITDVWGAKITGMAACLTRPLAEQDLWHTLALRKLERILLFGKKPEE